MGSSASPGIVLDRFSERSKKCVQANRTSARHGQVRQVAHSQAGLDDQTSSAL